MRKIVVYCDKCKCELDIEDAIKAGTDHDLCPDCVRDILSHYFDSVKAPVPPEGVDWGKAQALRNAGWCPSDIAEEIGQSAEAVLRYTKNPKKQKEKCWEFVEDEILRESISGVGGNYEIL